MGPPQIDPGLIWDDFEIFDFLSFFDAGFSENDLARSRRLAIKIGWKFVYGKQNSSISMENTPISIGNWCVST